jgi:hypothetical protein
MLIETSSKLHNFIEDKLSVEIKLMKNFRQYTTKGNYAEDKNGQKITWLGIKETAGKTRIELKNEVEKILNANKIDFEVKFSPQSSFPYIHISTKSKKEIRIVFKKKNGLDDVNYECWNENLKNTVASNKLKKPSDVNEQKVLTEINNSIARLGEGDPVTIKMQNKDYKNIIGFIAGPHMKKADFVGITNKGQEICFISYKKGSNAEDFQQYGGITERSGIFDVPEAAKFRKDVVDQLSKEPLGNEVLYRPITDNRLKNKAIFGSQYGRRVGVDNVSFLAQGTPSLRKIRDKVIELDFPKPGLLIRSGKLANLPADYEPVLGVRKGEAYRKIKYKNKTVQGRGGVWTKKYMKGRKSKEI